MKNKNMVQRPVAFRTLLWSALYCFMQFSSFSALGQEQKFNILFILTDDQAAWALGASGDPNASTPNLDRLAKKGAFFQNAFITTPVCSPSRASIMTSRYASEYGILDFIPQPGHRLYDPARNLGLDPSSITFAEVLQEAGYVTGLVGKWHLGDWTKTDDRDFHPTNHGFDYFMGLTGGGTTPVDPELEKDGIVRKFEGLTTDILTEHAMKFIRQQVGKPFLLCFNTRAPHTKWLPVADEDWAPFAQMDPVLPNPGYPDLNVEKTKTRMREYLASTRGVDRNVGCLLDLLDELDISERTIVIFFSDHGYNMGHNGIEHKGNGWWITNHKPPATANLAENSRPNLYDNSLKVPAIIVWPGFAEPGIKIDHTITSLDLYPTIVAMADAALPEQHMVRGRCLLPLLKGEHLEDWNEDYYGEYSMINYSDAYMRCYRTPSWKLVRDFLDPTRDELYHISLDPEENINLINDASEEIKGIVADLNGHLLSNMAEVGDPLLNAEKPVKGYYKRY